MASFSDLDGVKAVRKRLAAIAPGILSSLEIERIKQFREGTSPIEEIRPNGELWIVLCTS